MRFLIKTKVLIVILALSVLGSIDSLSQSSQKELGIRYLKLGNSYREARDYDNATRFLQKGLNLAGSDEYWKAVALEYMGYMERDKAFSGSQTDITALKKARNYLADAYDIYDRIITMEDGSPNALQELKLQRDRIDKYLGGNTSAFALFGSGNQGTLNYDSQKLKEFPRDIASDDVTNLSMKDNRLKSFPYEITRMKDLRYLNLSENKIKEVPAAAGSMLSLEWLDLSGNKIKNIPGEIAGARKLEILDLSNNRLKELPSSLCTMTNLRVLDVSGNKIEFERIKNLIQCLPNTNIIHDKYELKDEKGSKNLIFGQTGPQQPGNITPEPEVPAEKQP